jgi:hypothetical protein
MLEVAQRDVEIALARYARFTREFGDRQWLMTKPPEHLTLDMMPGYYARLSPDEADEYAAWVGSKPHGAST